MPIDLGTFATSIKAGDYVKIVGDKVTSVVEVKHKDDIDVYEVAAITKSSGKTQYTFKKGTQALTAKPIIVPAVDDHVDIDQNTRVTKVHKNCAAGCKHTHQILNINATDGKAPTYQISLISDAKNSLKAPPKGSASSLAHNMDTAEIQQQEQEIDTIITESKKALGFNVSKSSTTAPAVTNRTVVYSKNPVHLVDNKDILAKAVIDKMLLIKGTHDVQRNLINKLQEQLLELYEGADNDTKFKIYDHFKSGVLTAMPVNPSHNMVQLNKKLNDNKITSITTSLNANSIKLLLQGNAEGLVGLSDAASTATVKTGAPIEFTYTPPKPSNTVANIVVLQGRTTTADATNRFQVEASKSGKGNKAKVTSAIDAKTGFNMQSICKELDTAFTKVAKEKQANYRASAPSKRLTPAPLVTTKEQRDIDDAHKSILFGSIEKGKVVADPTTPKKHNKYELYTKNSSDVDEVILKTNLIETNNPTTSKKEEALQIVAQCDDLNLEAVINKDFDTSGDDAKRQAAVAGGLPKMIRKSADIIAGNSALVYLREEGQKNPKLAKDYDEDDYEKLIIAATATFSAHVFPIIDAAVWKAVEAYGKKLDANDDDEKDLKKAFEALSAGLAKGLKNANQAIETFRTEYTKGTAYEAAAKRSMKTRT